MNKERIQLSDTPMDIFKKMSEGNPGALNVLILLFKENASIDPDSALEGLGTILSLDSYGIYGSKIWILYKDICEENLVKMIAVLRACQLGLFNNNTLKEACNKEDYSGKNMVPVEELCLKVKEKLPNFNFPQ